LTAFSEEAALLMVCITASQAVAVYAESSPSTRSSGAGSTAAEVTLTAANEKVDAPFISVTYTIQVTKYSTDGRPAGKVE